MSARLAIYLPEISHKTKMPNAVIKNGRIETSRVFGSVPNAALQPSERMRAENFAGECEQLMSNFELLLASCLVACRAANTADVLKVFVEVVLPLEIGELAGRKKKDAIAEYRKVIKRDLEPAWEKRFPDPTDSPVRSIIFVDDLSDGCRVALTFTGEIDIG